MPGRTMLFQLSRREMTPPVFATCTSTGCRPRARKNFLASANILNCSVTDGASSTSEEARWVESPSNLKFDDAFRIEEIPGKSSTGTPSRPIPVSSLR